MRIRIELTGTTQLVMHNARLSDPLDEVVKQMQPYTSKRKKTEKDHEEIGRLEFFGGLYVDEANRLIMPAANIKRTLVQTAKVTREGKTVERALIPLSLWSPVEHDGPEDIEKLWEDRSYRFRTSVRVGTQRVQRTRPCFPRWKIAGDWELLTDQLLNLENFIRIVDLAGKIEGLGDHRTLGSGRFKSTVTPL